MLRVFSVLSRAGQYWQKLGAKNIRHAMREPDWVKNLIPQLQDRIADDGLVIQDGKKLPYANEILNYSEHDDSPTLNLIKYETDILVAERLAQDKWKPRLVVEVKLARINTHAAIAYSQKAATHKQVHPYLRYGILLADRGHYPLPGRLFRHGTHFDFMLSWKTLEPTAAEFDQLIKVIKLEVQASRDLEEIIFNTRRRNRAAYTLLHKPLILE